MGHIMIYLTKPNAIINLQKRHYIEVPYNRINSPNTQLWWMSIYWSLESILQWRFPVSIPMEQLNLSGECHMGS